MQCLNSGQQWALPSSRHLPVKQQALVASRRKRHALPPEQQQHQQQSAGGQDAHTAGAADASAAKAISQVVATEFLSGPQRSIHAAAEQAQQQQLLQQQQQQQQQRAAAAVGGGLSAAAIAAANEETSAINRRDVYKAIAISGTVCVLAGILDHEWVEAHQGLSMTLLFILGYLGIFVEEVVGLNKSGVALVMAVSLWVVYANGAPGPVDAQISAALAAVSELIFFLLGAMTVVEVVDGHGGFKRISQVFRAEQRTTLTWLVALLTFGMSAVLDNLTTTIVLLSILQRAVPNDAEFRKLLGAIVVVAANAGGAWTPIGDVTTTMLWVKGQITPWPTMRDLLLPSLTALVVPVAIMCANTPELQGPVVKPDSSSVQEPQRTGSTGLQPSSSTSLAATGSSSTPSSSSGHGTDLPAAVVAAAAVEAGAQPSLEVSNRDVLVLWVGLGALLFVPVFKYLTGLPPYMGMLSGLGILWMVTDSLHFGESKQYPRVQDALRNLDIGGVMFFLGILLSVEALDAAGLLQALAAELNKVVPETDLIAAAIGLASAVIDNVPLVAATIGMYDLSTVPQDAQLWQLIALCAGTGGSLLIIGSAAGVAYMGLEGASFGYYLRRVTPWVLIGYAAAIACYVALHGLPAAVPQ